MPLLNFQPRFVVPIRRGSKAHTIRADRKYPIKAGAKLYLYCGARHKGAYRILPEPVTCMRVENIYISDLVDAAALHLVSIENSWLSADERERLAVADGFANFTDMMQFWDGRLPFKGQIIHWHPQEHRAQATGKRICAACGLRLTLHAKWQFGPDGRPQHRDCKNTEGMPAITQQTELLPR